MTTHRADVECVMALVRQRLGVPSGHPATWHAAEPEGIVAVASAHFVLPALSAAVAEIDAPLPADLRAFLTGIETANRARNALMRDALRRIAAALNLIGVTPLVLKGGAFLADPRAADAAWRFMSDLDLLVDPARLDACVAAVRALGFTPADEAYDPTREAHFPPLVSPCGTFSVELHTRLFAVHEIALPREALVASAHAVNLGGAQLLLPSLTHRVAHLIAHAQIHNRFHMMRRVVLRDLLDLGALIRAQVHGIDWRVVMHAFPERRDRARALAFLAAWQEVTGLAPHVPIAAGHRRWAVAALARLHHSRRTRGLLHITDTIRAEAIRIATEPGHLRRRLAPLQPRQLEHTLARRRHKAAQKLWA